MGMGSIIPNEEEFKTYRCCSAKTRFVIVGLNAFLRRVENEESMDSEFSRNMDTFHL